MRIGAHISSAGGVDKAFERAAAIGAEAMQVFSSAPTTWAYKHPLDTVVAAYHARQAATGIGPTFIHAIYLINLGTNNPLMLEKSVLALTNAMRLGAAIGARGIIFHGGSHKGAGYDGIFRQTVDALTTVLEAAPPGPFLCVENSAGMGNHIGAKFDDIGRIMQAVGSPRMKVCMDTQHAFAAGYNLADAQGIDKAMTEFDGTIGLQNLVAVHANDSKLPLASGVDRHANIGEGHIGTKGFEVIMGHAAFRDLTFLLEVPALDGGGADAIANVQALKDIRTRLGVRA